MGYFVLRSKEIEKRCVAKLAFEINFSKLFAETEILIKVANEGNKKKMKLIKLLNEFCILKVLWSEVQPVHLKKM